MGAEEALRRLKKANYRVAKMAFELPRGGNLLRNLKTKACGRNVCDELMMAMTKLPTI